VPDAASPATSCQASHGGSFQIGGIYARSAASVFGARRRYDVKPLDSLRGDALNGAQFVYVAVPRDAVVPVLKVLRRWPNREIILDTPVLGPYRPDRHGPDRLRSFGVSLSRGRAGEGAMRYA
jgi:hypothetical protein